MKNIIALCFAVVISLALVNGDCPSDNPDCSGICDHVNMQSFREGDQRCNCNYDSNDVSANYVSYQQQQWDVYFGAIAHEVGVVGNPQFPFGSIIVNKTKLLEMPAGSNYSDAIVCAAPNTGPDYDGHAEKKVIDVCRFGPLYHSLDKHPDWNKMWLVTNIESCYMCFGHESYRGILEVSYVVSMKDLRNIRCWSQHMEANREMADHAHDGGKPFVTVRGPSADATLRNTVLSAFTNRCLS